MCKLLYTDIQGSCATNGDGLYEGLDWLKNTLTAKHVNKSVSKPTAEVKEFLMGSMRNPFYIPRMNINT